MNSDPQPKWSDFGADPASVCVAHCLHSISWTKGWILTKFAQTHYWEGEEKWLDFGDLDLIFIFTPALWNFHILNKKNLSAPYFLNQMTESGQTSYTVKLGWFKDLFRFWWPWPKLDKDANFTILTSEMFRKVNELKAENWRVQKNKRNWKNKKEKTIRVPHPRFELATSRWQNN